LLESDEVASPAETLLKEQLEEQLERGTVAEHLPSSESNCKNHASICNADESVYSTEPPIHTQRFNVALSYEGCPPSPPSLLVAGGTTKKRTNSYGKKAVADHSHTWPSRAREPDRRQPVEVFHTKAQAQINAHAHKQTFIDACMHTVHSAANNCHSSKRNFGCQPRRSCSIVQTCQISSASEREMRPVEAHDAAC
jgi:hypothetical protein